MLRVEEFMEERGFILSTLTSLGIIFIVIGIILALLPTILRLGLRVEKLHPLLFVGGKIDGIYIGTSPIIIIILAIIYLALILLRR